jgi:preprotein translocase subunit SecF
MFTLVALLMFGGPTIRVFLWVLLIGVIAGTYSSIGIATNLLVAWEAGSIGRLFRRGRPKAEVSV